MEFTNDMKIKYMSMAFDVALSSPDLSTQNGAVIIGYNSTTVGMGCNKLPIGVSITEERLQRPAKYLWTEHAERNAIYNAASRGGQTTGGTMFCPFITCHDCARAIVQSGIVKVYGHVSMQIPDRWADSVNVGFQILEEAGVEVEYLSDKLNVAPIRFNGELIYP